MSQPTPAKPTTGPGGPPVSGTGPSPGGLPQPAQQSKRLQQTQAQVDEVVDIMRVNVDKVLERDQKITELDNRADVLQAGASQFEASAGKLKRKFWWKNMKMMMIMGAVATAFVFIVGVLIYNKFSSSETVQQQPPQANVSVTSDDGESGHPKSQQNGGLAGVAEGPK